MKTTVPTFLEYAEARYWSKLYQPNLNLRTYKGSVAGGILCAMPEIDILAYNRVVGLGLGSPVELEDIDVIIDFFHKAGSKRFFVQVAPFAMPDHLSDMLVHKGFKHHNNWAKLSMPVHDFKSPKNKPGFVVKRVIKVEAKIYGEILTKAFEWPENLADVFAASVGLKGYRHYFAINEDRPIAAAAMHIEDNTASMAIAGTLSEYRGIGAQKQLLYRRLQDAQSLGCWMAVSETGQDSTETPNKSYRNMLKIGFKEEYLRKNYLFEF